MRIETRKKEEGRRRRRRRRGDFALKRNVSGAPSFSGICPLRRLQMQLQRLQASCTLSFFLSSISLFSIFFNPRSLLFFSSSFILYFEVFTSYISKSRSGSLLCIDHGSFRKILFPFLFDWELKKFTDRDTY